MSQELLICNFEYDVNKDYYYYNDDGLNMISKGSAVWLYTPFIKLPKAALFEWDFTISVEAQNLIYIQIERFNANKGSISNNAAINCIGGLNPSSNIVYGRYSGQIDLSTFGSGSSIQETAFIKVRIGNNYNNTSGKLIIHSWSLRILDDTNVNNISIAKSGQLTADLFQENDKQFFDKKSFVNGVQFYEY